MNSNTYQVIDSHTGRIIGTYKSRKRATNKADKLSNEHGSYRYTVQIIWG